MSKPLTEAQKKEAFMLKQQGYTDNTIATKMHVTPGRIQRYFGNLPHQKYNSNKTLQRCPWCGRKFIPERKGIKYCSAYCSSNVATCKASFYKSIAPLNKVQLEQLKRGYYAGESANVLAKQFDVSITGISYLEFYQVDKVQDKKKEKKLELKPTKAVLHRVSSNALYYL